MTLPLCPLLLKPGRKLKYQCALRAAELLRGVMPSLGSFKNVVCNLRLTIAVLSVQFSIFSFWFHSYHRYCGWLAVISAGAMLHTQNPRPLLGLNLPYFDSIPGLFRCACTLRLKWHWFNVLRLEWEIFFFVCLFAFLLFWNASVSTRSHIPSSNGLKKLGLREVVLLHLIYT